MISSIVDRYFELKYAYFVVFEEAAACPLLKIKLRCKIKTDCRYQVIGSDDQILPKLDALVGQERL